MLTTCWWLVLWMSLIFSQVSSETPACLKQGGSPPRRPAWAPGAAASGGALCCSWASSKAGVRRITIMAANKLPLHLRILGPPVLITRIVVAELLCESETFCKGEDRQLVAGN